VFVAQARIGDEAPGRLGISSEVDLCGVAVKEIEQTHDRELYENLRTPAMSNRPDSDLGAPDLHDVEAIVRQAIDDRATERLSVVGQGEFSLAMRWNDGPEWVLKRVPPFRSLDAATEYCSITRGYMAQLQAKGVRCVATHLETVHRQDGSAVVYHCQPLLSSDRLVNNLVRASSPPTLSGDAASAVAAISDAVVAAVAAPLGLDAQLSNWFWHDGEVWQLDFSTPLLLGPGGGIRFDTGAFLCDFPALLRPAVRREFASIAPKYLDQEYVLTDVVTNLHRDGLAPWCSAVAQLITDRHGIAVSTTLAEKRYRADARFYPTLLRLKRAERRWRRLTRRPYDSVLPETTSFGR
jgi:hypothetical protein